MPLAPSLRFFKYDPVVPTTEFIVPFPLFSNDEILVIVGSDAVEDYSVNSTFSDGVSQGAVVVLATAVSDVSVYLIGNRPIQLPSEYRSNSPNFAELVYLDMQKVVAMQQEAYRDGLRSLRVSSSYEGDGITVSNPEVGRVLIGTEDGFTNGPSRVFAAHYQYEAAPEDATDHDLTTAGGYKFYALASEDGTTEYDQVEPDFFTSAPPTKTIYPNSEVRLEKFDIQGQDTDTVVPRDVSTQLKTALDASSDEGLMLVAPGGLIGAVNPRMNGNVKLRGIHRDLTIFKNLDPTQTFLGTETGGIGGVSLAHFTVDGGWDLKRPDGGGSNWAFEASEFAATEDTAEVFGINLWQGSNSGDSDNLLQWIHIDSVAGSGIRRAGPGNGFTFGLSTKRTARWAAFIDDAQDEHMMFLNFGVSGLGGLNLRGGSHIIENAKLWFIGMAQGGEPEAALDIINSGTGNHQCRNIVTSDTAGTAIYIQGRNNVVTAQCLGTASLATAGGDVASGFGNPDLTQSDYAIVHCGNSSDNTVTASVHDKKLSAGEQSDVRPARLTELCQNNHITLIPRSNRDLLETIPFQTGPDAVFEAQKIRDEGFVNFVKYENGGYLHYANVGGLTTLAVSSTTNSINNRGAKAFAAQHFLADVERWITSIGYGEDGKWIFDDTGEYVSTIVDSIQSDPTDILFTPTRGDRYLISDTPASNTVWAGNNFSRAGQIATFTGRGANRNVSDAWVYAVPVEGHTLFNSDTSTTLTYDANDEWV